MRKVEFLPGPDRFRLESDQPLDPAEVARAIDTVIVGRGLRGLLDRIGARYGRRRDPSCPT